MENNEEKFIIILLTMGLSILPVEIVSAAEHTNVDAINVNMAVSRTDKIDYVYRIINGKLSKRLYNFTELKWLSDWVLCK